VQPGIVAGPMASSEHSIGTRTLRGMVWAYGSFVGGRSLSLIATAILARVLVPEDFGLVALALTLMALLEGMADLGLSQALVIQDDEVVEKRAETVFASSVALGFIASLVIAAAGPLAASFFDEPELTPIAIVLGSNFLLRSFGSTHYAIAQRGLDFRTRTVAEFGEVFVRGLTGIVLALAGLGAWSLVLGYLAGTLALVVILWALVPWRPKLQPDLGDLRRMIRFGTTISGVSVVASMISNVDYLFIGRVLGAASLGLYTLGFRLPELLIINLSAVASEVLFPAFSAIERTSLDRAFLISLRYTLLVSTPVALAIAVLAEPIVIGLFGDQWVDSIAPMQVLTIYAFAVTVGIPAGTAYKATGRAGVLLNLGIARLALVALALILFTDLGITAVAASQAAVAGAASVVGIALASRLLEVRLSGIFTAVWPAVCGAVLMAVPMVLVDRLVEGAWPALIAGGAVGLLTYVGFLLLAAPDTVRFLRDKMFPARVEPPEDITATRETDVIA
jgi:O-antigen/teichoic acid export membrane protein